MNQLPGSTLAEAPSDTSVLGENAQ